jgi:hypothetical protein
MAERIAGAAADQVSGPATPWLGEQSAATPILPMALSISKKPPHVDPKAETGLKPRASASLQ